MLTPDGLELYFASNTPDGNGPYQVFYTVRRPGGAFGAPQPVSLGGEARAPVLSRDGLTLYFSSPRMSGGQGKANIWVAVRSTISDGFGTPVPVSELNETASNVFNQPSWISVDGCRVYLSQTVIGVGSRVFVAVRPK
jgi:hypothetical protein